MPYMAEAITIPSPSVFLRASPTPPEKPNVPPPPKHARRQSAAETKKKAARKSGAPVSSGADGSVIKPKQSKSRNGIYMPANFLLSWDKISMLTICAYRLCDVQSETIEMW